MSAIRELQDQDAVRVSDLDGELFPDLSWNEYTIQREAQLGWGLVIQQEDLVVGYLLVRIDHDLSDIIRVGITKTHQGRGLGRELLQGALRRIDGRAMLTVHRDNYRARKLYLTEGFVPVGIAGEGILMVRES